MENTIIPQEKREVIRQELNIEKWPLFAPSACRKKSREITREVTLENGDKVTRKVTIGKVNENEVDILRIADYKIFNVLIKLWEKTGRPVNEKVNFTLYNVSTSLKTTGGGRNYQELRKALERLRSVPIKWEDSFYRKETDTTEKLVKYFNILEDLEIFERRKEKSDQAYFAFSSFKLNYRIIINLLNNYSKPLYLDVILGFEREISVFLYRHLDLIMADKNFYERNTEYLFDDIELSKYKYPSQRKRLLKPALKELEGVELTTGILSQAKLEKTVDGKDWKVVFKKSKKRLQIVHQREEQKEKTKSGLVVEVFNKRFPYHTGTLKEEMAESLIEKHTLDKVVSHISRISNDGTVNNPVGLLRTSLEKKWDLPPAKEEIQQKERQIRDEKERKEREKQERERERFLRTREKQERLKEIFFSLPKEEQERRKEEAKRLIIEQHIDDSQEKVSEFLLIDTVVMFKVMEVLERELELEEKKVDTRVAEGN